MLSPSPKNASCVYSLGTGEIPCTTQKSYPHRKAQSSFSAQTIKARFKKAFYTWQVLPDHRWSRTAHAILEGLHFIHRPKHKATSAWSDRGLGSLDKSKLTPKWIWKVTARVSLPRVGDAAPTHQSPPQIQWWHWEVRRSTNNFSAVWRPYFPALEWRKASLTDVSCMRKYLQRHQN